MANSINKELEATSVSPPGETLQELLEERGLTQTDLARRLGLTSKHVNEITKGKSPISPETAIGLERVLGTSATFWNNRERRFREFLARKEEEARLSTRLDWIEKFPTKEMIKFGFIPKGDSKVELTQAVLNFLGIASPGQWMELTEFAQVRYRKHAQFESNPAAVAVWLRRAEKEGHDLECEPYDEQRVRAAIPSLRALTLKRPEVFQRELIRICASCGIAVVFVPDLPKTCVYGVARWLTPTKALIGLSLRGKTNDKLWFSFFHELAHILLHGKKEVFLDEDTREGSEEEFEADRFARNQLVPEKEYKTFVAAHKKFFAPDISTFASRIGIHAGIVVGRLQRDGHLEYRMCHELKQKLDWKIPQTDEEQ